MDAERKRRLEMAERAVMAVEREDTRSLRSARLDDFPSLHHQPRERHLSAAARNRAQSLARSSFRL
ncbi:unnamed protein product [Gongylonema pulchrum]|uniref:Uncharacterized protein n=1 Tax=Gongylonema pulchrum TaxID=637853 RepID=A0A3P6UNB3_9BILA|nr:unnamed protein product [Gongylonema pulchrum]